MSEAENPGTDFSKELGTDEVDRVKGRTDMRRMGIHEIADEPLYIYANFRKDSAFWREFREDKMNIGVGIGGRGRRDAVNFEMVRRGGTADVKEEMPQHNRFSKAVRSLINPNWEAEERKKLGLDE